MLYRLFAITALLLCATMTTLLVRSELDSRSGAAWLNIPVPQILSMLFTKAEESTLGIYSGDLKYGEIDLAPRRETPESLILSFTGNSLLRIPMQKSQRLQFSGSLRVDNQYVLTAFALQARLKDPNFSLSLNVEPATDSWQYELRENGTVIQSESGKMGALLKEDRLAQFGINTNQIASMGRTMTSATVRARADSLNVLNDRIPTYHLNFRHAEGLETDIHISQTGKVLRADSFFGWKLIAGGLNP